MVSDTEFVNPLEGIWDDLPENDDPGENMAWFRRLSRIQQILYPTHYLCADVYNGGFHQYFSNTTALHAPEAIEGFRELGLNDIADLVQEAVSVFGREFPRERHCREGFLNSIAGSERSEWDPFFHMDDRFYELIKIPGAPPLNDDDRFTVAAKAFVESSAA